MIDNDDQGSMFALRFYVWSQGFWILSSKWLSGSIDKWVSMAAASSCWPCSRTIMRWLWHVSTHRSCHIQWSWRSILQTFISRSDFSHFVIRVAEDATHGHLRILILLTPETLPCIPFPYNRIWSFPDCAGREEMTVRRRLGETPNLKVWPAVCPFCRDHGNSICCFWSIRVSNTWSNP